MPTHSVSTLLSTVQDLRVGFPRLFPLRHRSKSMVTADGYHHDRATIKPLRRSLRVDGNAFNYLLLRSLHSGMRIVQVCIYRMSAWCRNRSNLSPAHLAHEVLETIHTVYWSIQMISHRCQLWHVKWRLILLQRFLCKKGIQIFRKAFELPCCTWVFAII